MGVLKAEDVIRAMMAPPVKVEVMMMKEGRSQLVCQRSAPRTDLP